MKRTSQFVIGFGLLVLLLAGGAFAAGRLLSKGDLAAAGSPKVKIGTGNGQASELEWVTAEELPEESPDVAGVFERRQDNSFFVNETDGGFVLQRADDGTWSVANATGKISEVVVTAKTVVWVDLTLENAGEAVAQGVLHQRVKPGTVEEIGEMSFVRAWGEMRGDRLLADVLLYSRPPVISR